MENQPLVSVVVITYNSAKYIIDTLESIYNQTYKNIELIISDDCSTDNTISLCKEWIKQKEKRFTNTQIIIPPHNTGISANCNRGYNAAQGEWIKGIAGDDALEKDCISLYMDFINKNPQISICHSKQHHYNNDFNPSSLDKTRDFIPPYGFQTPNAKQQFLYLCISDLISAPTVFFKKSLYDFVGGFDETIAMCEDYPMWLKITRANYPIYFLNEYTVKYRLHTKSVFGTESINYLFTRFFKQNNSVYQKYIKPYAPYCIRLANRYDYYLRFYLDKYNLNKKNYISQSIYWIFNIPYKLLLKFIFYFKINSK